MNLTHVEPVWYAWVYERFGQVDDASRLAHHEEVGAVDHRHAARGGIIGDIDDVVDNCTTGALAKTKSKWRVSNLPKLEQLYVYVSEVKQHIDERLLLVMAKGPMKRSKDGI